MWDLEGLIRAPLGLLAPCGEGGGLYTRIVILRMKSGSSANGFCSKQGGQAGAGKPREGIWVDSRSWDPQADSATSWHTLESSTPAVTRAMQLPPWG